MENVLHEEYVQGNNTDTTGEHVSARRQYLSFLLHNEVYAFSILHIKEIIEYASVTRVPLAPKFIRGVTNLRGNVVPVIDLAARLGKTTRNVDKRTCILLLEAESDEGQIDIGVVIDAINEVISIDETDIEPSPSFGAGISAEFISGMGKVHGKFVVLLDHEKVLSIEELSMIQDEYVGDRAVTQIRDNTANNVGSEEAPTQRGDDSGDNTD